MKQLVYPKFASILQLKTNNQISYVINHQDA